MRGGGDRRSIDKEPTVQVEPVGLGLMCDYNIIVGRGGLNAQNRICFELRASNPKRVSCYEIYIYSVGQGGKSARKGGGRLDSERC